MATNNQQAFVSATPLLQRPTKSSYRPSICMSGEPKQVDSEKPKSGSKPKKTIKSSASWAETFYPPIGVKGPGSRPHWDLRPVSLRPPEEGSGVCDNCKGCGTMTCTFCNGAQFFHEDGSPQICPACKGDWNMTCSVCFGSKKQIELVSLLMEIYNTCLF